jgi:hypothetical protein
MKFAVALFAASALTLSAPALSQNIVNNPGFETGDLTNWVTGTNGTWFVTNGSPIDGTWSASTGCVGDGCIHNSDGSFATTSGAFLYQDLVTTPGTLYNLSFDFRSDGNPNELAVLFGGTTAFDQTNISTTAATYTVPNLLATSSITRLLFLGRQDPGFNRLDNVSVVAAGTGFLPEPATWAMMLLGFGAVGWSLRRKRALPQLA